MNRYLLLFASLIVLAGCKKNPPLAVKDAPIGQIPQGWERLDNLDQGISLYAPPGWKIGAGTSMDLPDLTSMGGDTNQNLEQMQAQAEAEQDKADAEAAKALEKKNIFLSVIDKNIKPIPGEERTRFFVKRVDEHGNVTMEDVAEEVKSLAGTASSVTLPIGPAQRGLSTETRKDGGVVTLICYGIPAEDHIYVLEFITEEAPDTIKSIEQQVAESLRIKKKA